jgi:uncharacterized integral membrane protein (TIGR00698 family)
MSDELDKPSKKNSGFSYLSPEQANSLSSMEGDLEWGHYAESEAEVSDAQKADTTLYKHFSNLADIIPGIALAVLLAIIGKFIAGWLGTSLFSFEKSPFSPIMFIIILGIAFRNFIGVPNEYVTGLKFSVRYILRIGVALLGLRLSISVVGQIGLVSLPVVVICIAGALFIVSALTRFINIPSRLGTLIAVGTSICGVSAVVATSQSIKAEDDEVSYAVACVTIYGLCGLIFYPFLAHWLFHGDAQMVGIFLGTAIHDTSQVAGAGLIYSQHYLAPETLDAATVTKLLRNLFMIIVIPLMALLYQRSNKTNSSSHLAPRWFHMVPLFVVFFVCLAIVRSLGDIGEKPFAVLDPETWEKLLINAQTLATWCLTLAMASLGLSTSMAKIKNLGFTPLFVGFIAAAAVGLLSYLSICFISF